jgi:uncharacterized membrane protein YfcA
MDSMTAVSMFLGGVVGLILALTGAGGAIVAVPLLLFVLHLDVAEAAPLALLAVGLSAGMGAIIGLRAGIVRYRAAGFIALTGIVSSPVGLWLAHRLPNGPLALLFAGVLASVAIRMFMQARGSDAKASAGSQHVPPCQLDVDSGRFLWTGPCARALALSGIGAGFLSGLLGVGGGFVIVPALRRATNAPMHAIVATSLTIITLISLSGVVSTALEGRMNWRVGVPFAAGALFGMLGGRLIARHLSGPRLQQGFAVFAGVIAVGMVAKAVLAA